MLQYLPRQPAWQLHEYALRPSQSPCSQWWRFSHTSHDSPVQPCTHLHENRTFEYKCEYEYEYEY